MKALREMSNDRTQPLKLSYNSNKSQIFVSHSKDDIEGQNFVTRLTGTGEQFVKAYYYSFEGERPPHSITIIKEMMHSTSMFLLRPSSIVSPWTIAWISYEVGLAHALGKNIWVFDTANSSNPTFPVPFVTAYIHRPSILKKRAEFPYVNIVDVAGLDPPANVRSDGEALREFECKNEKCKAKYFIWLLNDSFRCPVCGELMKP